MLSMIVVFALCLFTEFGYTVFLELEREENRCDAIMKEIVSKDRSTVTDSTPSKLYFTWLSQQCEIRSGPEYIIRKYSFFENNTFHLLRYHYAEESCSIATYTLVARGSVEILSPSVTAPGASEANVQVDSVHLIPLNRQVAHKFGRRLNASCGGIDSKWRPYVAQLIYERPIDVSWNTSFQVLGLNSNSFKSRLPQRPKKLNTLECLESLGIEFTELALFRVEKRRSDSVTNSSNRDPIGANDVSRIGVELLLGEPVRNSRFQKSGAQKPNRLQSTGLLRADMIARCPICRSVFRGTEYSPPLFHQLPPLPAVIGGHWLSIRCESIGEGFWSRRFFQIYSSVNKWSARWTYYADSTCSILLYTVTTAGTYFQRAIRRKRDEASSFWRIDGATPRGVSNSTANDVRAYFNKIRGKVSSSVHRTVSRNVNREEPTTKSTRVNPMALPSARKDAALPSGTTELELHVIESRSISVGKMVLPSRCGAAAKRTGSMRSEANTISPFSSRNCAPRTVRAPAVLRFNARIRLDWNGDYTLLLASWNDQLWEAPLRRCSETTLPNYFQAQNDFNDFRRGRASPSQHNPFSRRGRYWFSSSSASCLSINCSFSLLISFLSYCSCFVHCRTFERVQL